MNSSSISEAQSLVEKMGYLKDKKNKGSKFSTDFISMSKEGDYLKSYSAAIRNLDYDIMLKDDSFFQFEERKENNKIVIRYAYFENPYDTKSYEDYLSDNQFNIADVGDEFREAYEQEMAESSLKDEFFPVRYDCSELSYIDGIHPYSHFHIGFDESLSIPIDKVVSPLAFVLFILKSRYYQLWKIEMEKRSTFFKAYSDEKKSLTKVKAKLFSANDKLDLYLT